MVSRKKNKRKRPTSQLSTQPKRPKKSPIAGPEAFNDRLLGWRFSSADKSGPFPVRDLERVEQTIRSRLKAFEHMNVQELGQQGCHSVAVNALSSEARKRLERLNYEDVDELWSFRCDGKKRLWCIKQMNICAILWWDPEHKVCPSIQKHT